MITNIFILAFCMFMTWLLYRFPLKKAKTPDDYRKLFLFFCAMAAFVLFNGLLAYLGAGGLKLASSSPPVTRLAELEGIKSGDGILLSGEISDSNDSILGDYIAYVDEDHLWSPMELWLDLDDGSIAIDNDTYRATGWPVDASGNSYLQVKQPVIVVGFVENSVGLISGDRFQTVRADIIFSGPYESFIEQAQFKRILAMIMVAANIFVAILLVILPIQDCLKGMKRGRSQAA